MSTTRQRKTSAITHDRLLEAAHRLLQERGAEETRLEDIAREAGVSRRAIYLHFKSRTDLLLALVAWIDERQGLPSLVEHIRNAPDAAEALNRMIELQATYNPHVDHIAAVLERAHWTDPAAATAWHDRLQDRYRRCLEVAERLSREGRLADGWTVTEAADLLWSMTSLRVWRDLVSTRGWSADAFKTRLQEMLGATLVRDAPPIS